MKIKQTLSAIRATVSFVQLVRDPHRLDVVIELLDELKHVGPGLTELLDGLAATETGAAALRERPRLGHVAIEELARLPPGTLGHEYAAHLGRNSLDPSALPVRPAEDDGDYLLAHFYETHDVWHAVTGFDAD